jgi:nucleotide-binding universal stress UspA family protein
MAQGASGARTVVGVGGSAGALAALEAALHVASDPIEAVLVESLELPGYAALVHGDTLRGVIGETRSVLHAAAGELEQRIQAMAKRRGRQITVRRIEGGVVESLLDAAGDKSLLVFGRGGTKAHLGTHAEVLVRRARGPVLVCRAPFIEPRRVVAAYAGKSLGPEVLRRSADLAEALDIPLEVLTVQDDAKRARWVRSGAQEILGPTGVRWDFIEHTGEPGEEIPRHAGPESLVVIGANGHTKLHRLLLGSVTEHVLRESHGPVMITSKGPARHAAA